MTVSTRGLQADLLLRNARVVTVDETGGPTEADALAILGDRVVALAEVPAREVIDLEGAVVTPGFHDAHNHMAWYGLSLAEVDLVTEELDVALERLAEQHATLPDEAWLVGSGYDENRIGRHPDVTDLERVAPGRRVWLKHKSGHMCVVSRAVLAELDIDDTTPDPAGGRIVRDPAGHATGLLQETAQSLVAPLVLPYPLEQLVAAIDRAGRRYLAEGITSVSEAGIGGGWIGKSPVELAAYQSARERDLLHVRVELMVASDVLHPLDAHPSDGFDRGLDLGLRSGLGDDRLRIGPVKVFADGSLIGRTAAMTSDFADSPGNAGYLQDDAETLTATILAAHRAGWRVATHAVGDSAIDLVLDAYEQAQAEHPRPGCRHRIEHFGVSRDDQLERAARLGVVPVPQSRFVEEIGDGMVRALGHDRVGWAHRARSLIEAGLVLPGSSDRPVVNGAPLLGMQGMTHRYTRDGAEFAPQETLTGRQALRAFTLGSAEAAGVEDRLGSLTPGKLADLVVLSDDPGTVDPAEVADIEVLRTMLGGRFVWSR